MCDARQLLAEYAGSGSETAFQEVVQNYVNLVYSTALRLVDSDADLAKDVTQNVFVDLAKMAGSLKGETMIGGWLHRHTCFLARKTMRSERRRKIRERHAMEMNANEDHAAANLEQIAPALDEAINDLSGPDRTAILARFFEQRDFQGVGQAIGGSEEAARKRVNRALEKLEAGLKRRGIVLSAAALAGAMSAGAVNAAPAGLAVVMAGSAAASAAAGGGTAFTILYIMNVTKTQLAIVGAVALALGTPLAMQQRTNVRLREENQALRQDATRRVETLASENTRLSNLVVQAQGAAKPATPPSQEVMKLRGEVGALRRTAEEATAAASARSNAPSILSGLTENPEMAKMIRNQQKAAMGMVYKTFADRVQLPKESAEKLSDLMADHIMTNINHITALLREGKTLKEMDPVFAAQEGELENSAKQLLGDKFGDFQDYTRNLTSYLTAEQFKGMMEGDKDAKEAKGKDLYKIMQDETDNALKAAGLPATYQTLPTLNFRNIASEEAGEQNLQLLSSIYDRVEARAGSTLSPADLEKFAEFHKSAISNNRMILALNRKMMAPPGK